MDFKIINQLFYHRLDVCISPREDLRVDAWLGAVLRNNLIYAAAATEIRSGFSLWDMIDTLSIPEEHVLYKELVGGFPKGFILSLPSPVDIRFVGKGDKLLFSLVLIGHYADYYKYFVEAIRTMCARGFGKPEVSLELIDIYEKHPYKENRKIAVGYAQKVEPLYYPIHLSDFLQDDIGKEKQKIGICYETPTLLTNIRAKENKKVSYQDKMNGFPSFYQLVRSVIFRVEKLAVLYACPEDQEMYLDFHRNIEDYLDNAASFILISASLERMILPSTRQKERPCRVMLPGYMGETVFEGNIRNYLPLLLFASELGVGNDTVYGLGKYTLFRG